MKQAWRQFIVAEPSILKGKPRIKDTRIPVTTILGYLAAHKSEDEILADYPDLKKEHFAACLEYARDLAAFEVSV